MDGLGGRGAGAATGRLAAAGALFLEDPPPSEMPWRLPASLGLGSLNLKGFTFCRGIGGWGERKGEDGEQGARTGLTACM